MAILADREFFRGEDITIEDTVAGEGDISGWGLSFAMARSYSDAATITKTTGDGITITDGPNRVFQIAIDGTDTDGEPTGPYVWDVKRTDAGQEAVLTSGKLNLKLNVAA